MINNPETMNDFPYRVCPMQGYGTIRAACGTNRRAVLQTFRTGQVGSPLCVLFIFLSVLILAICIHALIPRKTRPASFVDQYNVAAEMGDRWIAKYRTNGLSFKLSFLRQDQISVLTGLPVRQLIIENGSSLSSFGDIAMLPLEHLSIYNSCISDLTPLKKMQLRTLVMCEAAITNLDAVCCLTSLEFLDISRCNVTTLDPLRRLSLSALSCAYTHVRDLSPLKNMPLKYLNITKTDVSDLSPLEGVPLLEIWISTNRIQHGWQTLRRIQTLQIINGMEATDFWKITSIP